LLKPVKYQMQTKKDMYIDEKDVPHDRAINAAVLLPPTMETKTCSPSQRLEVHTVFARFQNIEHCTDNLLKSHDTNGDNDDTFARLGAL
jgi:hypothetical protein